MRKWVYNFGAGQAEGSAGDVELLGSKGANLAEMSNLGLAVPAGMTIITEVCNWFHLHGRHYPDSLGDQLTHGLAALEQRTGRQFGGANAPLLLSVRPGARTPVPGMLEAVLNLGLNDKTADALAAETDNPEFAWQTYLHFVQSYTDTVLGLGHGVLEELLEEEAGELPRNPANVSVDDLKARVRLAKSIVKQELDIEFPDDPNVQLWGAIEKTYESWMTPLAVSYRQLHNMQESWGAAINIQAMVFGNLNDRSATGTAFTRDPKTGEKGYCGTFLPRAQGSALAAGTCMPHAFSKAEAEQLGHSEPSLEASFPDVYAEFSEIADRLERDFREVMEVEFTVENGRLWLLQSREAKLQVSAAMRAAVGMHEDGLIDRGEAIARIDPLELEQLLHPTIDPSVEREVIGMGLPASPGAASGRIVFRSVDAIAAEKEGRKVILVRQETSPEDVHGMHAAQGVITSRGGLTSHAAVVARGMGIPCVAGAGGIRIDMQAETMTSNGVTLGKGDFITIDGTTGQVLKGRIRMTQPELSGDFATIMKWSDEIRRLRVRTNGDTPMDARIARNFGAEGIGLCRTEHMFFDEGRINIVREAILATSETERQAALQKLLPMQRSGFVELFEIMHGQPVVIRLLDPPLHEFLPKSPEEIAEVAELMGCEEASLRRRIDEMHEFNPMLGHRGCRLAISFPEIAEMQARAIFEAAVLAAESTGAAVVPEVMVPLVSLRRELDYVKARIDGVAAQVAAETGVYIEYLVGTMIELPRAALRGKEIAEVAEFFSFGTNDLTQTTFGISRDDAGAFLTTYRNKGILDQDPFASLDVVGVGELIEIATERGRMGRHDLKLGICGEHGGDPASIHFCEKSGLDYVSCSPFRVPVARLAAAQAVVQARTR